MQRTADQTSPARFTQSFTPHYEWLVVLLLVRSFFALSLYLTFFYTAFQKLNICIFFSNL